MFSKKYKLTFLNSFKIAKEYIKNKLLKKFKKQTLERKKALKKTYCLYVFNHIVFEIFQLINFNEYQLGFDFKTFNLKSYLK